MHVVPDRPLRRRNVGALTATLLVAAVLVAGATYTGAGADAARRPVTSTSLTCQLRWLLSTFLGIGTPCAPSTTTTQPPSTTLPPSTTTSTVSTAVSISGTTSLANCGMRYYVPCGWGTPASANVEARGDGVLVTTRSDEQGRYSLTLPAVTGPVTVRIVLEQPRVLEQCVNYTYRPEQGTVVTDADIACNYAIGYGTRVPCYTPPTTPMIPPTKPGQTTTTTVAPTTTAQPTTTAPPVTGSTMPTTFTTCRNY